MTKRFVMTRKRRLWCASLLLARKRRLWCASLLLALAAGATWRLWVRRS